MKLLFVDISYPMLIPASVFQTIGSGKYMCMNNLRVVIAKCLGSSWRNPDGIRIKKQ